MATSSEPVAIVGMGCRLPGGVTSPDAFWQSLVDGLDAIGEVPAQRWAHYQASQDNAAAVARTTRLGGFVSDVDDFDAAFFGISPREATLMDPQQRMALEVSWEALEHAGIVPAALAGTNAGVFVGVNTDDHGRKLLEDLPRIEAWTGIGSSMCAVANRVSYALDLRGPSMVVDTACSSSLVALHLACQSLRAGEAPVAIAGGVMLMMAPGLTMVMDSAGALAPDGRSKSFDASADGYGRGEGCGMVVLKLLSDARRDGDRVLAVVRGSAVNQDGRTNGIMAPSRDAQEHMLRRACLAAGVAPESVDYVEAHGTGTRAGDPVEAGAIAAVYGSGRPADRPCLIGSVKSNIGHLEAASGIAGVIKAVLAIEHAQIPPSLNFDEPNPDIPWAESGLRVVTDLTSWPSTGGPRRAGVSGYGYGGTIAHLVLEQAPRTEVAMLAPDRGTALRVFPLSGGSPAAVRDYATALADWLTGDGLRTAGAELADVAYTLTLRRSHLARRTAVVASGGADLIGALRQLDVDEAVARPVEGAANGAVWVFSGHGSQWIGMGRELLATEPAFGRVLDELEPVYQAEAGLSPRKALLEGDLRDTDRIQMMIFAMQLALAEVWYERGLRPAAVIGHSVGEIAAAVVAGMLDLADGARLICRRSALLRRVAGEGAMAMVNLPFAEVERRLAGHDGVCAAIAAAPASTVIAGDAAALEKVVRQWSADTGAAHPAGELRRGVPQPPHGPADRRAGGGGARPHPGRAQAGGVLHLARRPARRRAARRRLLGGEPAQPGAVRRRRACRAGRRLPRVRRDLPAPGRHVLGQRGAGRAGRARRGGGAHAAPQPPGAGDAAGQPRRPALPRRAGRLDGLLPGRAAGAAARHRLAAPHLPARGPRAAECLLATARRRHAHPARRAAVGERDVHRAAVADPARAREPPVPRRPSGAGRGDRAGRGAAQHVLRGGRRARARRRLAARAGVRGRRARAAGRAHGRHAAPVFQAARRGRGLRLAHPHDGRGARGGRPRWRRDPAGRGAAHPVHRAARPRVRGRPARVHRRRGDGLSLADQPDPARRERAVRPRGGRPRRARCRGPGRRFWTPRCRPRRWCSTGPRRCACPRTSARPAWAGGRRRRR